MEIGLHGLYSFEAFRGSPHWQAPGPFPKDQALVALNGLAKFSHLRLQTPSDVSFSNRNSGRARSLSLVRRNGAKRGSRSRSGYGVRQMRSLALSVLLLAAGAGQRLRFPGGASEAAEVQGVD